MNTMQPSTSDTIESIGFEKSLREYSDALIDLLSEPKRRVSFPTLRTTVRLARGDANFRKALDEMRDELLEIGRLDRAGRLDENQRRRVLEVVGREPATLTTASATDLLQALHLLVVEAGDARAIFLRINRERSEAKGTTSWLTWDQVFTDSNVPGLDEYLDGVDDAGKLEGARRRLLTLIYARHEAELVRHTRQAIRARTLKTLSVLLAGIVAAFVWFELAASPSADLAHIALVPLAGGFGALMSGAIRVRDGSPRAGDILRFQDALPAQLLVGAASALVVLLVLDSGLIQIAGVTLNNWPARAVFGFISGFSEPIFVGTVDAVTSKFGAATGSSSSRDSTPEPSQGRS